MPLDIEGFIKLAQAAPSLRFLVIGGYAVGIHGFSRMTDDIDFLANRHDREAWLKKLGDVGLAKFFETPAFAQFHQEKGEAST